MSARASHYYLSVIKATERVDITFWIQRTTWGGATFWSWTCLALKTISWSCLVLWGNELGRYMPDCGAPWTPGWKTPWQNPLFQTMSSPDLSNSAAEISWDPGVPGKTKVFSTCFSVVRRLRRNSHRSGWNDRKPYLPLPQTLQEPSTPTTFSTEPSIHADPHRKPKLAQPASQLLDEPN